MAGLSPNPVTSFHKQIARALCVCVLYRVLYECETQIESKCKMRRHCNWQIEQMPRSALEQEQEQDDD